MGLKERKYIIKPNSKFAITNNPVLKIFANDNIVFKSFVRFKIIPSLLQPNNQNTN
jgi:hypothetical protein